MKKNHNIRNILLLVVIVSSFMIGGGIFSLLRPKDLGAVNPTYKGDFVTFEVKNGVNGRVLAKQLKNKGLIRSSVDFYSYLKTNNIKIKTGKYLLKPNMTSRDIIIKLSSGKSDADLIKVQLLEGQNLNKFAMSLEKINVPMNEFLGLVVDKDFISHLASKYEIIDKDVVFKDGVRYPLEGYLYPDTYYFNKGVTAEQIIEKMVSKMNDVLKGKKKDNFSYHMILTLASVVELESPLKYRSEVAGVFLNRLKLKEPLGSDVTTYYGLNLALSERDLYHGDLNKCNPYNTRMVNGKICNLYPIGPIGAPSMSSINAVLNPAKTDSLFFVSDKNGKLYFTKTNKEHVAKVRELKNKGLWYEYR